MLAVTLIVTALPVIAYGTFRNEFIRVSLVLACAAFGFFAEEHFLIRIIVSALAREKPPPAELLPERLCAHRVRLLLLPRAYDAGRVLRRR